MTITDLRPVPVPAALTVVLAYTMPEVRGGLRSQLSTVDGVAVVAEAETGPDMVRETLLHRPDVLIMDLRMGGPQAIGEVLRSHPGVAVLVISGFADHDSVFAALRSGARGCLLAGAGRDDIARAVRGVAAGEAIFCAPVAERLTELFGAAARPGVQPLPSLTIREREVLELIATGMGNAMIAYRLGLAKKTIVNVSAAIVRKLRVANRAEAVDRARAAGLGDRG